MGLVQTIKMDSWIKFSFYVLLILAIYHSALTWLVIKDWQRDGYSYGYLIPFVVLYLLWLKRSEFRTVESKPSWLGLFSLLPGLLFFWLGELGGEFLTLYVSMWLVFIGLCWMHFGWRKLKVIGFPLFFILTMFPLPAFLNTKLMLQLRLISSKLGVAIIQFYGLPAYREGNIIDLGFTQLQVVEACSGLHSLISLVVLCLLLVYFFRDHIWKRVVLFISSIPLAILTNSMRIAMTAILYKYFGAEVADSFFHDFSGLVVFGVNIPVLIIEMKILEKLPPVQKKANEEVGEGDEDKTQIPGFDSADIYRKNPSPVAFFRQPVFIAAVILLGATLAFSQTVEFREKIPVKKSLTQFPLTVGEWKSKKRQPLEQIFLTALDLSEYVMANYWNGQKQKVNFYVAYYESQSKGESIHSPASCMPGGGWTFDQSGPVKITDVPGSNGTMEVNRAVMQSGQFKQISYYWFPARGRVLKNAYELKIYNFWDALTMQRTDGALVRLITPIYENEKVADAEKRLQKFVRDISPVLEEYIPGKDL